MSDREYYSKRAAAERKAAMDAADMLSFRAHMDIAREYEWRASTAPYPETPLSRPRH